ncbi:MAG TPA: hypothetical protein ENN51_02690 [candidate division WOR-3 bacterium]|uniref:Lipoprotein n=1 Tax=candidate division WOR-3 bacterium TaxID=2052148 RepID=A0A7V0T4T8_UNCW3|nr:hypothetical protein [candidate division WOR-3 bacterium]
MKKTLARAGIAGAVLSALVVLVAGCGFNMYDGLVMTLRLDHQVIETGDTLSGRLVVRNLTGRHRSLTFPTNAQYYLCAYDALNRIKPGTLPIFIQPNCVNSLGT